MIVENCHPNDEVPYGVFVRDIVKSFVQLVDRYSIELLNCDIGLYKYRYDVGKLSILNFCITQQSNVSVSDMDLVCNYKNQYSLVKSQVLCLKH